MEINNKIPFFDVVIVSKYLCEHITGERHEIIYAPVTLKDEDKLNKYLSVLICKEKDVEEAVTEVVKMNDKPIEEYFVNRKYCHIATFPENTKRKTVDFDMNSDSSIKANINEEYSYVDNFFRRFINFRNNLIENNQVVKSDDIYQFYASLTGFAQNKKKSNNKSK